MSRLKKLRFVNNVSGMWKILFELYDWIRWSNENGDSTYADYWYFMSLCEDEILRLGLDLDTIPRYTTDENFASRWFYLEGKFKNVRDMQNLFDCESYRIMYFKGIISVRFKQSE